jgi:hypothetical protein
VATHVRADSDLQIKDLVSGDGVSVPDKVRVHADSKRGDAGNSHSKSATRPSLSTFDSTVSATTLTTTKGTRTVSRANSSRTAYHLTGRDSASSPSRRSHTRRLYTLTPLTLPTPPTPTPRATAAIGGGVRPAQMRMSTAAPPYPPGSAGADRRVAAGVAVLSRGVRCKGAVVEVHLRENGHLLLVMCFRRARQGS